MWALDAVATADDIDVEMTVESVDEDEEDKLYIDDDNNESEEESR